jgi:molybdopterin-guanine dinucleotide biosynthesis protein A
MTAPHSISGYILAGGRSSRMGADKCLLPLAGNPLIAHAVTKLRRVCADVHILSANPALAAYAPLVPDLHPNHGPVGGIEAALAHTAREWNLILPVDVPFLPAAILQILIAAATNPARVAMFTVADGYGPTARPQPAVCLLHREIAPSIAAAVALGELKLLSVLEAAAEVFALQHNLPLDQVLRYHPIPSGSNPSTRHLWFANLNIPQDLADAEANSDALET